MVRWRVEKSRAVVKGTSSQICINLFQMVQCTWAFIHLACTTNTRFHFTLQSHPVGSPVLLEPSLDAIDLAQLETDIKKWLQWLSAPAQAEWDDFFENLVPELRSTDIGGSWLLEELHGKVTVNSRRAETAPQTLDDIFASERATESHVSIKSVLTCMLTNLIHN